MRETYFTFLVALAICVAGALSDEEVLEPQKRLISTFQIVRFPNDACIGTNSRNGTCYTSAECSDKSGTSSGSCADGFGVCCTFIYTTCGQTSSQNITYWDQTPTVIDTAPSSCTLKICPLNTNICQLRIDFDTFVITGPSTSTLDEAYHLYGAIPLSGVDNDANSNWRGNCLLDSFSVNGVSSSNNPPTICGTNTGYHMYVDANPECNTMAFLWTPKAGPTNVSGNIDNRGLGTLATRNWDIKVLQYECGHINAAPPGCTQYYWGVTSGRMKSYNYAGSIALANQNQKICVRRERSYCYACWAASGTSSVQISGRLGGNNAYTMQGQACGWSAEAVGGIGNGANQAAGYDCVIIPGAFMIAIQATGVFTAAATPANIRLLTAAVYQTPVAPQISSGGVLGPGMAANLNTLIVAGNVAQATICTKHVPFMFQFKSDSFEGLGEAGEYGDSDAGGTRDNAGFDIDWFTYTCT